MAKDGICSVGGGSKRRICVGGGSRLRVMAVKRRPEEDGCERGKKKQRISSCDDQNLKIWKKLIDHKFKIPEIRRDLGRVQHKSEGSFENAAATFSRGCELLDEKLDKSNHQIGSSSNVANEEKSGGGVEGVEVSPEKASRAAMLKARFAHTIRRATQTLRGEKVEAYPSGCDEELKMRRERERKALEEMERRAAANVDNTVTFLNTMFGPTWYQSPEAYICR